MLAFAIITGTFWLLFELITVMLNKTWVASIVLPCVFLIALIPIRGCTVAGTIVFMAAVLYTLIYATLLTLRGLIPLPRPKKKTNNRDERTETQPSNRHKGPFSAGYRNHQGCSVQT